MAEHHEVANPAFPLHGLEAEQGSQGFAGSRPGVDQHVMAPWFGIEQAGSQQLDQPALPLPGSQGWGRTTCCQAQIKGREPHGAIVSKAGGARPAQLQMSDLA